MTITSRGDDYAAELTEKLDKAGFRVEKDLRNEKIGYKIREAQVQKIPYMIVIGDKEAESGCVSVRSRDKGDLGVMTYEEFLAMITAERDSRSLIKK